MFTDGYTETSAEFGCAFQKHQDSFDALNKLASDFEKKNVLTCLSSLFLKGCEAQLNSMRCEIAELLKFIKAKRDNATAHVKAMTCVLAKSDKHVASFVRANNLKCASHVHDYCKLKQATTQFFTEFNENHWAGHKNFLNLQYIADQVTSKVSIYTDMYNSNCSKC